MQTENAIEIRNMYKSFKVQTDKANSLKSLFVTKRHNKVEKHEVLKDINLDIQKGETVCLIGNNGCGKSTLLKLMTRIIYPNKGTVQTNGKIASLLELGAGFHPDFTGRENIYFNGAIFGMTHEQIDARLQQIIDFSELGEFIDEPIRTYSSGMYMRLAFSIAINVDADILLIDEILAVGDQHFQDKCFDKLRELKDDGDKTIVIVSHSLDVVKELCTRAIWVYKGHINSEGDPAYVIEEYLDQMSKDHREQKKLEQSSGKSKIHGIIFIDAPKDYNKVCASDDDLMVIGWKLCDDESSIFEILVGNTAIENIQWKKRDDVMSVYSDDFSGLVDETKVGWKIDIPMSLLKENADTDGYVKIEANIKVDDKIIQTKNVKVCLEDE